MRKFLAVVVSLVLVVGFPSETQAATCSSSQANQIRIARSAVATAQRNLGYQQGYYRLQLSSSRSAQTSLRAATRKVDSINKALNLNYSRQAKANRVEMIDLTVAARELTVALANAEQSLAQAQSWADREEKWLEIKQRGVDDASKTLAQKQADLTRYESRCSSY